MIDSDGISNYIFNGQAEETNKESNLQELKKVVDFLKKKQL